MAILPGTRIRDNGVFGTTTDNPLTAGATTFNSARLADLSTVAGNHALVTLDPLRQFGNPEIVMVTAHTAAATVATIQRGMFGTTARSHPVNTLWVHAAADNDYREVVTSITRPADQYASQPIYETDTNRMVSFANTGIWQQDGLFFDPPACRVFNNAAQSLPDATETTITFNSERYDTDNMHSAVNTSRITFNTAGLYQVGGSLRVASGGDYSLLYLLIMHNGGPAQLTIDVETPAAFATEKTLEVNTTFKFVQGDFIELRAYQDNTANAARNTVVVNVASPEFWATWIGRGN